MVYPVQQGASKLQAAVAVQAPSGGDAELASGRVHSLGLEEPGLRPLAIAEGRAERPAFARDPIGEVFRLKELEDGLDEGAMPTPSLSEVGVFGLNPLPVPSGNCPVHNGTDEAGGVNSKVVLGARLVNESSGIEESSLPRGALNGPPHFPALVARGPAAR